MMNAAFAPASPDDLRKALENYSMEECGVVHENSELLQPVQCTDERQEEVLGCLHSSHLYLRKALRCLLDRNLLSRKEAEQYRERLHELALNKARLDVQAMHEYEFGPLSAETEQEYRALRETANGIRLELIELLP